MTQTHSLDLELSSSQHASITDASQTGLDISTDFTIEAWIKIESALSSGELRVIASKYGATAAYYFVLYNPGGVLQLRGLFQNGSGATFYTKDFAFATDTWYHVAMTADISASSIKLYINGVDVSASAGATAANTVQDTTTSFRIGARNDTASNFWDGLVKDVRVFSDIRTASEIISDIHAENVSDANLEGEWNLNEVYTDGSGNGNTLTASGSPVFDTDIPSDYTADFERDSTQNYTVTPQNTGNSGTVEFWMDPEFLVSTTTEHWVLGGTGGAARFLFYKQNLAGNWGLFIGGGVIVDNGANGLVDDDWTHIAIAWDSAQSGSDRVIIYKNGVEFLKVDADPAGDMPATLYIGSNNSQTTFYDGKLGDIRIWDDQRTASEIADNYCVSDPASTTGLIDHWKLQNTLTNEVSGSNALTTGAGSPTFVADIHTCPIDVNDERNAITHGSVDANDSRSAKATGQDSAVASRSAETHGIDTTNDSRPATAHGAESANDSRDAKVHGIDTDNDSRSVKTHGQQADSDNRSAKTHGTASTNDSRDAKVHGSQGANASRSAKTTGTDVANDNRSAKVHGQDTANSNRDAKVHGQVLDSDSRSAITHGQEADNDSRASKLHGETSAVDSRSAKTEGISDAVSSRDAKTHGATSDNDSRSAKVNGIAGANDNRSAKTTGAEESQNSRSAKTTGQNTAQSSRSAVVTGNGVNINNRDAKTDGQASANASRSAKVTGGQQDPYCPTVSPYTPKDSVYTPYPKRACSL